MKNQVLNKKQEACWPLLLRFKKNYGLVGGTAIALQLQHRQSIDFDLFTTGKIDRSAIRREIINCRMKISRVLVDSIDEYTIMVNNVRVTFLHYPFPIKFKKIYQELPLANLTILAAMKAYALGRRAKWKDYVDIVFIAKELGGLEPIIKEAEKIFGREFSEKIFREQLVYFKDIDYSEEIVYLSGHELSDATIKKQLKQLAIK